MMVLLVLLDSAPGLPDTAYLRVQVLRDCPLVQLPALPPHRPVALLPYQICGDPPPLLPYAPEQALPPAPAYSLFLSSPQLPEVHAGSHMGCLHVEDAPCTVAYCLLAQQYKSPQTR